MVKKIFLEKVINNIDLTLPISLQELDTINFGLDYKLFDYQQNAINNTIKLLYFYFNGSKKGKTTELLNEYKRAGLDEENESSFNITRDNDNFSFMSQYYPIYENRYIEFKNIINRAGFWMATGSGKTIIMIKLVEILFKMAKMGYIPEKDILILAPKDTILEQIKEHINIFNRGNEIKIDLRDLREFEKEKQQQLNLFSNKNKITIFYYRADNIREENKDVLIDYKTYLNGGNWYLILDEAHKGDNEFSKQQQYYNVFTQNGFLFNFSATFVDELDIATTIYNFNLERFLSSGYGKHIKLTNQEFRSFRKNRDLEFDDIERQKIVLKSLITYAAIKKSKTKIEEFDKQLFHNPLMITVANSVNTMDADLKIFFQEISKIAQGQGDIDEVKTELIVDFRNNPQYYFNYGEEINSTFFDIINSITKEDIVRYVFNAETYGTIEIITISNNSKEIAFKLTTSSKPFALLVASDAVKWTDNILSGYSHSKDIISESFFENINDNRNSINILMGSRIFVEGWDSNRPNVINFINLGVGDAQKLVLQTIGRGVRINPYNKERKRIENLIYKNEHIDDIIRYAQPVQSLYIFSTNKAIINDIMLNLDKNNTDDIWVQIRGIVKNSKVNQKLLKPVIESDGTPIRKKYKISEKDYEEILNYLTPINAKIALIDNGISINTLNKIKYEKDALFKFSNIDSKDTEINNLLKINKFLTNKNQILKKFDLIQNEDIQSYRKIQIKNIPTEELNKLETQIKNAINNKNYSVDDLVKELQNKRISTEEFLTKQNIAQNSDITYPKLDTKLSRVIQEHYYNPMLVAKKEYKDLFRNIIKEDSEIDFINKLVEYISKQSNCLKEYDWWYFSKLVENVDNIKIPYYNSKEEVTSQFYPDFIFWLKKDKTYYIKFVDPKGIEHPQNAVDKILSFEEIFNEKKSYNDLNVICQLYYYNQNEPVELMNNIGKYWTNNFDNIFKS